MNPHQQPVCVLIAALGGEGGGILTNWIVQAATACDLPVQSTSIPGVAQRTGATTYYIEIFPRPFSELDGPDPVMGLYPAPGRIDLMVASEILEAARAMENGFVTSDLTTLISSTHRVFAISEKSSLADGRYDRESALRAAKELARDTHCADFLELAQQEGSALNAVLLGVIARTAQLPIPTEAFVNAIKDRAIAVDTNLRGFDAGLNWAPAADQGDASLAQPPSPTVLEGLQSHIVQDFPAVLMEMLSVGAARTVDFQDVDYAKLYLNRIHKVLSFDDAARDYSLCREVARYLALWMSYEDIIRVADLKSRPERYARVREEVQAAAHEPVLITEFFKPGVDELAAVLPARLGHSLHDRRGRLKWMKVSLRLNSHTILGHQILRLLAGCRRWRPKSLRWQEEQALIDRWLDAVCQAAPKNYELALEVARCANLNKGYGDTFTRGRGNFIRILEALVEPATNGGIEATAATRVKSARNAALSDDTGASLDAELRDDSSRVGKPPGSEPVKNRDKKESGNHDHTDNITQRRIA